MYFTMHLTAWIFAGFVLVVRLISDRIHLDYLFFMNNVDIETLQKKDNFVTKIGKFATDRYYKFVNESED